MKFKYSKYIFAFLLTAAVFFSSISIPATESTVHQALTNVDNWQQIALTPGSDPSQLNFAWYTKKTSSDTDALELCIGKGNYRGIQNTAFHILSNQ